MMIEGINGSDELNMTGILTNVRSKSELTLFQTSLYNILIIERPLISKEQKEPEL